ncbi:cytochrome c3 family protein, partial [Candidatus Sumerlaeota bacterium]|nr:cytochrome c3 family protein [Candidatus Sumerlaeota bacterium]
GITAPSDLYYQPEHSAHSGGDYGAACADCHAAAFKQVRNEQCLVCHPGAVRKKPKSPSAKGSGPVNDFPQAPAAAKFHAVAAEMSCNQCHLEHKKTDLGEFLLLKPALRAKEPKFPDNVHAFIPEAHRGPDHCIHCHEPAELEGTKAAAAPAPAEHHHP